MSDTKMLQMVLDGQAVLRKEISNGFYRVDQEFKKVYKKIDNLETKLTKRLDKLGKQLAYLEDDTPTREEFGDLENRMTKVESKLTS